MSVIFFLYKELAIAMECLLSDPVRSWISSAVSPQRLVLIIISDIYKNKAIIYNLAIISELKRTNKTF
jgi:hypothetical protein